MSSDLRGSTSLQFQPARPNPALLRSPRVLQRRSKSQPVALGQEAQDDVSLKSFANAPPSQTRDECLLFNMPPEINYEIMSYLPYHDARALKNSCRFFRMYITPDYLAGCKERWKSSLLNQELAGEFVTTEKLPCYTCVRLRPAKMFPSPNPHSSAIPRYSERACIECSWKVHEKGEAIWIDHRAYTRCEWCGRARRAYRFGRGGPRPGLCECCGRTHRLLQIWPVALVQMAEILLSCCCIAWTAWAVVDGWLTGYPDDKDWNKVEIRQSLTIIPMLQIWLSLVYVGVWHRADTDNRGLYFAVMVNFCFSSSAWVWALCESGYINKDIAQGFQLSCFVTAAGISAIVLNFLRLVAFICTRGKVPF